MYKKKQQELTNFMILYNGTITFEELHNKYLMFQWLLNYCKINHNTRTFALNNYMKNDLRNIDQTNTIFCCIIELFVLNFCINNV